MARNHNPESDDSSGNSLPGPATTAQRRKAWGLLLGIGLAVTAIDLWTKEIAFDALGVDMDIVDIKEDEQTGGRILVNFNPQRRIDVIPGYFQFEASLNTGAFHGWFSDFTFGLAILSLVALVVIALILRSHLGRDRGVDWFFVVALGLLWGGTLGNFYDRYFHQAVRDFIKWYVDRAPAGVGPEDWVWPNFNIADSAICVGVALVALHILLDMRAESRMLKEQAAAEAKGAKPGK